MENLNAEQIVNLLEHCSKSKYCDGCTMWYNPRFLEARSFNPELVCGKELIRWATELIKELTKENKRLEEWLEDNLIKQSAENVILIGENERLSQSLANSKSILANSKADTVRKMQEQLKMEIDRFGRKDGFITKEIVCWFIDQIAKEMLEGEK